MAQAAFRDYQKRKTSNLDWVVKFDVDDYVENPPMIRALYEARMTDFLLVRELREGLEAAEEANQALRLDRVALSERIDALRRARAAAIWLSPLAALLAAAGSGLIAGTFALGFLLIVGGVGVQIAAVLLLRSRSEDD